MAEVSKKQKLSLFPEVDIDISTNREKIQFHNSPVFLEQMEKCTHLYLYKDVHTYIPLCTEIHTFMLINVVAGKLSLLPYLI